MIIEVGLDYAVFNLAITSSYAKSKQSDSPLGERAVRGSHDIELLISAMHLSSRGRIVHYRKCFQYSTHFMLNILCKAFYVGIAEDPEKCVYVIYGIHLILLSTKSSQRCPPYTRICKTSHREEVGEHLFCIKPLMRLHPIAWSLRLLPSCFMITHEWESGSRGHAAFNDPIM